jgi:hypothetical protein
MELFFVSYLTYDAVLEVVNPTTAEQDEILHLYRYRVVSQAARSGDVPRVELYLQSFDLERLISVDSLDKIYRQST